eukprot:180088-Rhodomonas_salina.2
MAGAQERSSEERAGPQRCEFNSISALRHCTLYHECGELHLISRHSVQPSVLCARYVEPGSEVGCGAIAECELDASVGAQEPGGLPRYPPTRVLRDAQYCHSRMVVPTYALTTQCPVLTHCMRLGACYAVPGTDRVYAATSGPLVQGALSVSPSGSTGPVPYLPTNLLCGGRY